MLRESPPAPDQQSASQKDCVSQIDPREFSSATQTKVTSHSLQCFGGVIIDRMHNYFVIHCLNEQQLLQFVRK